AQARAADVERDVGFVQTGQHRGPDADEFVVNDLKVRGRQVVDVPTERQVVPAAGQGGFHLREPVIDVEEGVEDGPLVVGVQRAHGVLDSGTGSDAGTKNPRGFRGIGRRQPYREGSPRGRSYQPRPAGAVPWRTPSPCVGAIVAAPWP